MGHCMQPDGKWKNQREKEENRVTVIGEDIIANLEDEILDRRKEEIEAWMKRRCRIE